MTIHPPPLEDELLTPGEVARMFRVDPKTVTRWAKSGKLPARRTIGGHRRYRRGDIAAIVALDEPVPYVPATRRAGAQYVYVASSWRNDLQPAVVSAIRGANIGAYDFKNPDGGTGFAWREVGLEPDERGLVGVDDYFAALDHPRARAGFDSDFEAMHRADAFVLVLPCGRSAHLELGWAVGAGKRTAIVLDDPCTPELMYRMVDLVTPNITDVVDWLRGS